MVRRILGSESFAVSVLAFWFLLLFWGGAHEARPGMDAMIYGALAKNVLSTEDWKVLHLSQQSLAEFYQHPPLVIWLNAWLFEFTGATDLTQRILPSSFALGCLALVYLWLRRSYSYSAAILGALILLSTTRFIKYSSVLMLDPFLTFFILSSVFLAWRSSSDAAIRPCWVFFISGVLAALAFLSKGMPALAVLPVLFLLLLGLDGGLRSRLGLLGIWVLGALVPMLAWFWWGDGWNYLGRYWSESVSHRLGGGDPSRHWGPILGLLKSYWPWFPVLVWAIFVAARRVQTEWRARVVFRDPLIVTVSATCAILGGFIASGHFLEQYLVPVFPFSAMAVAIVLHSRFEKYRHRVVQSLAGMGLIYGVLLVGVPLHVHGDSYRDPARILLSRAATEWQGDAGVQRIAISSRIAERWRATALGAWYTPWDVWTGRADASITESQSQLLLARDGEVIESGWKLTELHHDGMSIYRR